MVRHPIGTTCEPRPRWIRLRGQRMRNNRGCCRAGSVRQPDLDLPGPGAGSLASRGGSSTGSPRPPQDRWLQRGGPQPQEVAWSADRTSGPPPRSSREPTPRSPRSLQSEDTCPQGRLCSSRRWPDQPSGATRRPSRSAWGRFSCERPTLLPLPQPRRRVCCQRVSPRAVLPRARIARGGHLVPRPPMPSRIQ